MRITTQLVQARPEKNLWAESYERDVRDVLSLQSEVARVIAREIQVELTPENEARLARERPVDPDAYTAYLRARYSWNKRTAEGNAMAVQYLQEAIEHDPALAVAHVGLADTYILTAWFMMGFGAPPTEAMPKAKAAVERALEIDPSLGEAYRTRATVRWLYDWDFVGAERDFEKAIELAPNDATAHQWYGEFLWTMAKFEQGTQAIERAQEADPLSLIGSVIGTWPYYYGRRYDEAVERANKVLTMEPDYAPALVSLGSSYAELGRWDEAVIELKKARSIDDNPGTVAKLSQTHARAGRRTQALQLLRELQDLSTTRYVDPYNFTVIYASLGEHDEAMEWLQKGFEERSTSLPFLKIDPAFE